MVEDDFSLQVLYEMILKMFGFEVIGTADNGEDAIDKFNNFLEKPEIVIMDYRIPIKDGIDASKEILKSTNKTKIIFASADASVRELALSIGVSCFLEKPFSSEELINSIKKILKKNSE
ncbi:MAG: response regulator [Promethearchaeota archaeon]